LSARVGVVVAGLVLLAAVHVKRPSTVCLLRATTGVPCPFCGGTTAAVELGQADPVAALAASPLATGVVLALPFLSRFRAGWQRVDGRLQLGVLAAVLASAEVWQLARFGLLS
jgi:hypothetical protein